MMIRIVNEGCWSLHPLLPVQTPKFALQMWDEMQSPRHDNSGTQQLTRVPSGSPPSQKVSITRESPAHILETI
jgi:hypothetical protein